MLYLFTPLASEKKNFLLYYAVPLLRNYLPELYALHLMLLVGGLYRLLKESISPDDRESSATFLKLFCAQASALYGMYLLHWLFKLCDPLITIKGTSKGCVKNYNKVESKCYQASCLNTHCDCQLELTYFTCLEFCFSTKINYQIAKEQSCLTIFIGSRRQLRLLLFPWGVLRRTAC